MTIKNIENLAKKCREASVQLAVLSTKEKNNILKEMAKAIIKHEDIIIKENHKDLKKAEKKGLSKAMIDRLILNEKRIKDMADGLIEVSRLKDPVGQVIKKWTRPNGLKIQKIRIPLGVIGVVYESRPNVTVDAAGLCFKSGNAVILRGGSEAFHSNQVLGKILGGVLKTNGLAPEVITLVPTTDRKALTHLLSLTQYIDVMIPRGGESLMKYMNENSKIPVIKHDQGICNLYVDKEANLKMALDLVDNGKTHRPGVCNALENVFVHEKVAAKFLPKLFDLLDQKNVELRGDTLTRKYVKNFKKASLKDWDTEYLDLILSVKTVSSIEEAILEIREHGSLHTEVIVSKNKKAQDLFVRSLDSSCIMVNASSRFNDGGQLGLGAEIGISTTKLHAFGPMGLEELTTSKYVVHGKGQVRK
jgi:glutamate-5-semialdehyde dehydrogenase